MQKALVLSTPFLVDPQDPGQVGTYPVDSDIFFHFGNALNDLGWETIFPAWTLDRGRLRIDEALSLSQVQTHIDGGCDQLTVFFDVNFVPSTDNNEGHCVRLAQQLRERYGSRVRVATFIPDAYLHPNLKEILEACAQVSDIVISPYRGTAAVVQLMRLTGVGDKLRTIATVPTRFFADLLVTDPQEPRVFDVCYVGSLSTTKSLRADAMQVLLTVDGIKLCFSTAGRTPVLSNPTRQITDYLRIYCSSVFSVCSPAGPQALVANMHETLLVYQPAVFPGRVAESICCACLPLYIRENRHEVLPLPQTGKNFPYIDILPGDMAASLPGILDYRRQGLLPALEDFREYHARYLSAQAVLQPLVEELWVR